MWSYLVIVPALVGAMLVAALLLADARALAPAPSAPESRISCDVGQRHTVYLCGPHDDAPAPAWSA